VEARAGGRLRKLAQMDEDIAVNVALQRRPRFNSRRKRAASMRNEVPLP
jgi:hypothetical protein